MTTYPLLCGCLVLETGTPYSLCNLHKKGNESLPTLEEVRARAADAFDVFRFHIEDYFRKEALPHNHPEHPFWNVRGRVIQAPVEYHQARYDAFQRERKRQEEKFQKRDNNQSKLHCGCVVTYINYSEGNYRTTVVHFCPSHWKERKRA